MEAEAKMDVTSVMNALGAAAKTAASELSFASAERKHAALIGGAHAIRANRAKIAEANALDMAAASEKQLSKAMLDRLLLTDERIEAMAQGLEAIAAQPDPVGATIAEWKEANGLNIRRVRSPLGVIGVIYESRPNVTADAGALCLKSGNAAILRGGSESFHSATAIHECLQEGLRSANLPDTAIQLVPTRSRDAVGLMLGGLEGAIDVIVPRGGKGLVGRVQSDARVPVFAHLEGICHIYIDASADQARAEAIVLNAKTRRTGICGAVECLLFDKNDDPAKMAGVLSPLLEKGVEIRGDETVCAALPGITPAQPEDFGCEFLDMIVAARVVDGVDGAIEHIREFGSSHTESIIAEDPTTAERFLNRLDSAILMHNTSTQFADGGEFGMGAEIGIATGKMHARGPIGAEQLTTFKYIVTSDGAVRA